MPTTFDDIVAASYLRVKLSRGFNMSMHRGRMQVRDLDSSARELKRGSISVPKTATDKPSLKKNDGLK